MSEIKYCTFDQRHKLLNPQALANEKGLRYLHHFKVEVSPRGVTACPHYHDSYMERGLKGRHRERYLHTWLGSVTAPL